MPASRDTMYWAVFILYPNDVDKLESWHHTGDSARLREARLNVEHPDTWRPDVKTEVRMILRSELPGYIPGEAQVAA